MSDKYFKGSVRVVDMSGSTEDTDFTRMGQKHGPALGQQASAIARALYAGDVSSVKKGLSALKDIIREIESQV